MKKIIMTNITLGLLILIPTISQGSYCVEEHLSLVSEKLVLGDLCEEREPPFLGVVHQYYPLMERVHPVQIWFGGYSRNIFRESTHLKEMIDVCGRRPRVISSSEVKFKDLEEEVSFTIYNPNLSQLLIESFKLSPLTDSEAQFEYERTKLNCENFQLNR